MTMPDPKREDTDDDIRGRGLIATFFMGLARDAFRLFIAFVLGTGGAAIICWYYNIPLVFAVLGGLLVLGIAVAFLSDSFLS